MSLEMQINLLAASGLGIDAPGVIKPARRRNPPSSHFGERP
jgi:hypothetical protein